MFEKFRLITTIIFDIDGVLTDGTIIVMAGDHQVRKMHVRDGLALQMAMKAGLKVIVISGGVAVPVLERLNKLGINEVHLGIRDKLDFVANFLNDNSIEWEEVLFMGDDLPDIPLLKNAGVSACPADAIAEIRDFADYISPVNGGNGCVRDVIEKILKIKGQWQPDSTIPSQ